MSSPHPTHHQCYHKDRENHTNILHQQENFVMAYCIYLPSPAYSLLVLSHQCKGSGKNSHQSLNYGRTATMREREREQQDWHQQEDLRLHWHVNSGRIELIFSYLLWSVIPPLWRIQKELPPQLLSLSSRNCRKNFLPNHVLQSYRSHDDKLWHRLCPKLTICSRRYHYNRQVKIFRQTLKLREKEGERERKKKAVDREEQQKKESLQFPWSLTAAFVSIRCALGRRRRSVEYCKSCWWV